MAGFMFGTKPLLYQIMSFHKCLQFVFGVGFVFIYSFDFFLAPNAISVLSIMFMKNLQIHFSYVPQRYSWETKHDAKTCICNVVINDLYWPIVPRSILYSMLSVDHHVDCKHMRLSDTYMYMH